MMKTPDFRRLVETGLTKKNSSTKIALLVSIAAVALCSIINFSLTEPRRALDAMIPDDEVFRSLSLNIENKPLPTTFLLGIFSYSAGGFRRQYIRDTYLGIDDERICKLSEFIRQTEEDPLTRKCVVPYAFIMGGGGYTRPPDHNDFEPLIKDTDKNGVADPEGDCIYLNIRENMEDGKSSTYLKYGASLAREYGIDYVGKLDDDSVLAPKELFQLLVEELPPAPYNTRIYGGPPRLSRIQNHMYAAGEFYFVSSDLADYVGNTLDANERESLRLEQRHVEDLDMGTFIHSHPRPIKFFNLETHMIYKHPLKSESKFRDFWENKLYQLPYRNHALMWHNYCIGVMSGKSL